MNSNVHSYVLLELELLATDIAVKLVDVGMLSSVMRLVIIFYLSFIIAFVAIKYWGIHIDAVHLSVNLKQAKFRKSLLTLIALENLLDDMSVFKMDSDILQ